MSQTSISFTTFLEEVRPGSRQQIDDVPFEVYANGMRRVTFPDITLACTSRACKGPRYYSCESVDNSSQTTLDLNPKRYRRLFLTYKCRNCNKAVKLYALALSFNEETFTGVKVGEYPLPNPAISETVLDLLAEDRHLWVKGRRAEEEGLGIAALSYYRMVVLSQRDVIFGHIVDAARRLALPSEAVDTLVAAAAEDDLEKAIEMTQNVLPESLKTQGHNPLEILYRPITEQARQRDDTSLDLAKSMRILLNDFAEKLTQVVKDDSALKEALAKLTQL